MLRKEGHTERAIFVVDKQGTVRYRDIHDINEQTDNEDVFQVLRQLEPEAAKRLAEAKESQAAAPQPAPKRRQWSVPKALGGALRRQSGTKGPKQPREAGRKRPTITMYCTPWCPDCRAARQYLDERGHQYSEIDVSKSKAAEKKARELAGGRLVTPTIDIDGTVILDFDRKKLDDILGT